MDAAHHGRHRPRVIVSNIATVDGRITTRRSERLLEPHVGQHWRSVWPKDVVELVSRRQTWLDQRYHPTAILEGSGSFVADDVVGPTDPPPEPGDPLLEDFIPHYAMRWFVVVDGRGRVDWQFTGDGDTALLVLVCRRTPASYLQQLHDKGIPYLVAGKQRVDLAKALGKLRHVLSVRCLVCEGGGALNGALLRAGLVDEVHIITVPALVGGLGTPTMFDGEELAPDSAPITLRCTGVDHGRHGTVWSRYDVVS